MNPAHSTWQSPIWQQLYGNSSGYHHTPSASAAPDPWSQEPTYIQALQQAASAGVPQHLLSIPAIDEIDPL